MTSSPGSHSASTAETKAPVEPTDTSTSSSDVAGMPLNRCTSSRMAARSGWMPL